MAVSIRQQWFMAKQKLLSYFKQGLSPLAIIKSVIVSVLMTIIPFYGITTIALTTLSIRLKLNLPLMVAVSYLSTPLQILLFIPFIRIGEHIFSVKHTLYTVNDLQQSFKNSIIQTIANLSFELICGLSGWLVVAFPIAAIAYYTITYSFGKRLNSKNTCRK